MHIRKFPVCLLGAVALCLNGLASSQSIAPESGQMSIASSAKLQSIKSPRLPAEVEAAIKRLELCHHFPGEIGGDGSVRDKEIGEALRRYHCDKVSGTIKSLKRKYQSNDHVFTALKEAEEVNQ